MKPQDKLLKSAKNICEAAFNIVIKVIEVRLVIIMDLTRFKYFLGIFVMK